MKYPIRKILTLLSLLGMPACFVDAQNPVWINNVTTSLLGTVLPTLIDLLIALAVIYFMWGMVIFIAQSGSDQARADGKKRMIWGIVALFVLVSVWGLVALLQSIAGVDSKTPPLAPQVMYDP